MIPLFPYSKEANICGNSYVQIKDAVVEYFKDVVI